MGILLVAAAGILWGSLGPAARVGLDHGMPALEISFYRGCVAALCFLVHARWRGSLRIARADWPAVLGFAFLGVTALYVSYFQAVRTGGATLAAVLLYTAPAWVALFSVLWLAERMTARKLVALALTLGGVAMVVTSGGGTVAITPVAVLWGLVSGFSYALFYLFGKRYFLRYDPVVLFAWAIPIGMLPLLALIDPQPRPAPAWGAVVFLGLVPTYLAYLLYAHGLMRLDATRTAVVATIEPVVAALLGFAIFGEALGLQGYAGAGLVLTGVVINEARSGRI
ncbi:MAG: EamA family transporter [Vicinamibacterales bacterium]|nr:EamA family transporter [Vicinamibacterales bacterium]